MEWVKLKFPSNSKLHSHTVILILSQLQTMTLREKRVEQREANKNLLSSANPLQHNDYILLQRPHQWQVILPFPCDFKLACILPMFWKLGFITTGSDQSSAFIIFKLFMSNGTDALIALKTLFGVDLRVVVSKKLLRSQKHPLSQNAKFVVKKCHTLLQFRFHPMWISRLAEILGIDAKTQENLHLQKQKGGLYFQAWLRSKDKKRRNSFINNIQKTYIRRKVKRIHCSG